MPDAALYTVRPLTNEDARRIARWQYPGEYAVYSFEDNEDTRAELMNGEYVACIDARGDLVGYFCFGGSARIPTVEDDPPDARSTDVGLGLAPALCGRGLGRAFLRCGIEYAKAQKGAADLRLVVAAFNRRAITLYESCGFVPVRAVTHRISQARFIVMRRTAADAAGEHSSPLHLV